MKVELENKEKIRIGTEGTETTIERIQIVGIEINKQIRTKRMEK